MPNRRQFLAMAIAGGGPAAIAAAKHSRPSARVAAFLASEHHHGAAPAVLTGAPATVTPFSVPMPVPPVLRPVRTSAGVDEYQASIEPALADIVPGFTTPILGYGGQFVGPTIRARRGRPVQISYVNRATDGVTVHLHGGHTPAASDGYPMDLINPGDQRTYTYPNLQRGTTLWYHDHAHMMEAEHVYRGLHGFYLLEDEDERQLGLPSGEYDVPIMIRDALIDDSSGALIYGNPNNRNLILVNGKPQPYFQVAARKYRFRLLNSANERTFSLSLDGTKLTRIGSDGGLLPEPIPEDELVIGAAERAEVVVDFSAHPVGSQLVLSDATMGPILRLDVVRTARDDSRLPDRLRPMPRFPAATVVRDVTLSFDLSGSTPIGLVNGRPFDPTRDDFVVKRGTTEIWRITNGDPESYITHNFHMHLEQFQVLDRNGQAITSQDAGLKDTTHLGPGETVRLQTTFHDYVGTYVFHCHFLEHSSIGMMAQMKIVP